MKSKAVVIPWSGPDVAARDNVRSRATLVCTAADARFFPLVEDLIASLERVGLPAAWRMAVLDVGLTADQVAVLRARGALVLQPDWYLPEPMPKGMPMWFRGLAARPYLHRLFPGYTHYLHLDADTYVLRGEALADLVAASDVVGFAVVFEHFGPGVVVPYRIPGGGIGHALLTEGSVRNAVESCYVNCFGPDYAWCAREFICNNGIWAMRGDAPHWDAWARYLARALQGGRFDKLMEQQALCLALLEGAVPAVRMPNTFNWNIAAKLPVCELREGHPVLLDPDNGDEIAIVHLTDLKEVRFYDIAKRGGGVFQLPLRYRELSPSLRAGTSPNPASI